MHHSYRNALEWIESEIPEMTSDQRREYELYMTLGSIASTIASYRVVHGLSQKQLANALGVTQAMVSKYESGEYNFTIKTLHELANKLGMVFHCEVSGPLDDHTIQTGEKSDGALPFNQWVDVLSDAG